MWTLIRYLFVKPACSLFNKVVDMTTMDSSMMNNDSDLTIVYDSHEKSKQTTLPNETNDTKNIDSYRSADKKLGTPQRKRKISSCNLQHKQEKIPKLTSMDTEANSNSIDNLFAPDAVILTNKPVDPAQFPQGTSTTKSKNQVDELKDMPLSSYELDLINFFETLNEQAHIGLSYEDLLELGQVKVPKEETCHTASATTEKEQPTLLNTIQNSSTSLESTTTTEKEQPTLLNTIPNSSTSLESTTTTTANIPPTDISKLTMTSSTVSDESIKREDSKDESIAVKFSPKSWDLLKTREMIKFLKEVRTRQMVNLRPKITSDMKRIKIIIQSKSSDDLMKSKIMISEWLKNTQSTLDEDTTSSQTDNIQSNEEQNSTVTSTTQSNSVSIRNSRLSTASGVSSGSLHVGDENFECRTKYLPEEYWNYIHHKSQETTECWCWVPSVDGQSKTSEKFMDRIWSIVKKYNTDLRKEKNCEQTRFVIIGPCQEKIECARNEVDDCIMAMNVKEGEIERVKQRTKEQIKLELHELELQRNTLKLETQKLVELETIKFGISSEQYNLSSKHGLTQKTQKETLSQLEPQPPSRIRTEVLPFIYTPSSLN